MDFIGRGRELEALDRLWNDGRARFLVLYGRRRIGKTRLLTHWQSTRQISSLYWVAKPDSSANLLRSFSQALYLHGHPGETIDPKFTYPSWEMVWQVVAEIARRERFALILDEFTYTLDATPELAGTLQNAWDQTLSQSNLFLVVSGSHLGMMERELFAYRAPLYGRASARMHLEPLPFGNLRRLFPRYDTAERIALYATLGGVPAYLERFEPNVSLSKNIKETLLSPFNLMQEEPRLLIQEQLSEPRNYMAILEAIAHDRRVPKEIAEAAGIATPHVSKYLSVLRNLRLVHRDVPATLRHPERSRQGRYQLRDPYLRFYFRFLANSQEAITLGRVQAVWQKIQRHMVDFIGTHTYEDLCREWIALEGDAGRLPFYPDRIGSFWSKRAQIDVVAIQWMSRQILLGECKWTRKRVGKQVVRELLDKTPLALPDGDWTVHYAFFSRSGFTDEARRAAEGHSVFFVDLERLEEGLIQ